MVSSTGRGGNRTSIINDEIKNQIRNLLDDNSTKTLEEIKLTLNLNVTIKTLWTWVKNLGYTYKLVRPVYEKRNNMEIKLERQEYIRWYISLLPSQKLKNIIYIDESPFSLHLLRKHGWEKRGETPNPIIRPRSNNINMILAVYGSVNAQVFSEFLSECCSILGTEENYIFIMDNVSFHHSVSLPENTNNFSIRYLPAYSPMLNPCEEVFSYIKSNVRTDTAPSSTTDLIERMRNSALRITRNILENYIRHMESFTEYCLNLIDIQLE